MQNELLILFHLASKEFIVNCWLLDWSNFHESLNIHCSNQNLHTGLYNLNYFRFLIIIVLSSLGSFDLLTFVTGNDPQVALLFSHRPTSPNMWPASHASVDLALWWGMVVVGVFVRLYSFIIQSYFQISITKTNNNLIETLFLWQTNVNL